ncbi:hypothetical protein [Streptomyces flavofungini]|uniref:hypothetical protein n=1 Tax=Streptomyces flavofungini TaxID=68200 RepID=UPI0025B0E0B1|nr:hypothetical protein [Streptomyces flavofungini]WJV51642.1 hypothetical protein QUY26_38265 [Streptomyces flavofungini]
MARGHVLVDDAEVRADGQPRPVDPWTGVVARLRWRSGVRAMPPCTPAPQYQHVLVTDAGRSAGCPPGQRYLYTPG